MPVLTHTVTLTRSTPFFGFHNNRLPVGLPSWPAGLFQELSLASSSYRFFYSQAFVLLPMGLVVGMQLLSTHLLYLWQLKHRTLMPGYLKEGTHQGAARYGLRCGPEYRIMLVILCSLNLIFIFGLHSTPEPRLDRHNQSGWKNLRVFRRHY